MAYLFPTAEPKETKAAAETTTAYLRRVREGSCYGALRAIINLSTWCSILAIVGAWGFFSIPGLMKGDSRPATLAAGVAFLAMVLVAASRQSALLLIDIADTLIEAHREKPTPAKH